ncbi:flagellar hook-length control protein FliK [Pseudobutyrivibrio xylanivorans]|uniref:Hook-length control protein FliK n=1 Tax=Pseudobutyrivibrio xylanivorans DSM 14809 TaxID=1123012 RepID=A0A1M6EC26_PSEXY|nr:flagellar hook-length control protein FliK [Pseudobutyrivibrio xylanivorans]SHI82858.1 hook-length control protein FliK [Pseudobutyrivibrio xylanivorans DSM 14809]
MNINTGLNPYGGSYNINAADTTKMSQSQSLTGSVTDNLKEGEIFEGSVNSIDNGKVTIGLANGQTMTARLDSGVSLVPGQSVFFQVKSNDGNLVQIRPVSLNSLDANPTLLKALDMANIAVNERTINMVNSLMQNSLSINPENLTVMNRAMLNNPQVDPQTLVTMAKYGLELSPENISMFQNYANDKAALANNFDIISEMLPELMSSDEVSAGDVINLNNQLRAIFVDVAEDVTVPNNNIEAQGQITEEQTVQQNAQESQQVQNFNASGNEGINHSVIGSQQNSVATENLNQLQGQVIAEVISEEQATETVEVSKESNAQQQTQVVENQVKEAVIQENIGTQTLNSFAGEKQIASFNTILSTMPDFPKDNLEIFGEDGTLKADANIKEVFREISDYLNDHPDIPKETLNDIIKAPLYKGLLKNLIADSFTMEPKDVTKAGQLSKLYERVLKQTDALEKLISNFSHRAAETIKNQTTEIRQNINFMNNANEMYNFVQIPLKMYNQNTDSMLYVRQNKKSSYEEGEEITAFLHFDMENLGPTDVFISLKEMKVGCKWNLADESALKLIEDNIDILTERLAAKGFTCTSEMTCGEPKTSFVEDFLGAPKVETENTNKDGIVHRYSFDMRA